MLPKLAFFGTNYLSAALLSELKRLDFEIVGLWDQTLKTASLWCSRFDIPLSSDSVEELLKNQEVDLVIVCAPAYYHKEITTKALAAGKHVICEPPLGMTATDNAAIMELAFYYPSLTMSTFGLRHLPGVKRAKVLLGEEVLGKIQSFEISVHCGPYDLPENVLYDWTCIRELCAGPLFSSAIHIADLISYLSGQRIYTVCGTVRRFQENPSQFKYDEHLTREDYISWQGLLEGDIPCSTVINNNFPGKFEFKFMITGSKSSLVFENGNLYRESPGQINRELECALFDKTQTVKQSPALPGQPLPDYRYPDLIVRGIVSMCSSLKDAFQPHTERRHWSMEKLAGAGTFQDCQLARAVVEAVKKSSETRKWTEVRIPTKTLDGSSLSVSLAKFHPG